MKHKIIIVLATITLFSSCSKEDIPGLSCEDRAKRLVKKVDAARKEYMKNVFDKNKCNAFRRAIENYQLGTSDCGDLPTIYKTELALLTCKK